MAIDGISSNINNVSSTQSSSLERLSTGLKINQASDDASSLAISDAIRLQRSDLSQSLQNLNQGIALTRIATDGLQNQKEILEGISAKLIQANTATTSADGKDAIKQEIIKSLEQFKSISDTTKFNDQKLIDNNGAVGTLDISTSDVTHSVEIPNTGSIADDLLNAVSSANFNAGDIPGLIDKVTSAVDDINLTQSEFAATENQLESSARNSISEQVNLAKASSSIIDVDFGKEINDFSKANILTQIGYLVSTQANAHQEQNLKLLV